MLIGTRLKKKYSDQLVACYDPKTSRFDAFATNNSSEQVHILSFVSNADEELG